MSLSKDCTQTSVELLQRFADQYRSGAAGAEMDCDAAQALAEAIDSSIRASEPVWQDITTAPRSGLFLAYGSYAHPNSIKTKPTEYMTVAEMTNDDQWPFRTEEGMHQSSFFSHWQPLPCPPKPLSYEGEQS